MANIYSANSSSVTLDGVKVEGIQSLAFRVVTEREDIRAVGQRERVDVSFGLRTVLGEVVVKSHNPALDQHLEDQTSCQLVANLKKDKGIGEQGARTYAFDACFIEGKSLRMEAGGVAVTSYAFTATSVKETAEGGARA